MKKLYIFDLDGTLVDTITDVSICFNKALNHFGFRTHDLEDYPKYIGGNLETNISRLLNEEDRTEENINKLKLFFEKTYLEDKKENTKPFEGITEMLNVLKEHNILMAISSNKKENLAIDACKTYFSNINFIKIAGYVNGTPSKPDPSKVYDIIKMAKVSKEETVYVGDANTDIETAKNAGIDCLLVRWGQAKPEDFENKYVKQIIETPKELIDFQ